MFAGTSEKALPKGFSAGVSLWGLRSLCVWPTLLAGKKRSPRKGRGREVLHVLVKLLANNLLSRPLVVSFSTTVMPSVRQTRLYSPGCLEGFFPATGLPAHSILGNSETLNSF